jgi:hypothetical protein
MLSHTADTADASQTVPVPSPSVVFVPPSHPHRAQAHHHRTVIDSAEPKEIIYFRLSEQTFVHPFPRVLHHIVFHALKATTFGLRMTVSSSHTLTIVQF